MAVTSDIVRTWRGPRAVMRDLLAHGPREDRAIAYLMAGCLLIFLSQWPRLAREAHLTGHDLQMLIGTSLFAWLMLMPLAFYGIAAASHLVARALGGQGTWAGARLALFWTILATAPILLVYGLTVGFLGVGAVARLVGAIWVVAFVVVWVQCLREAERPRGARA